MFEKKTTVIVGAGASTEFGLPTGYDLKRKIAELLDVDVAIGSQMSVGTQVIFDAIQIVVHRQFISLDISPYRHAARKIRDAIPQAVSIDNFLDAHEGDRKLKLCGKLAICRAILEAEHDSRLYVHQRQRVQSPDFRNLDKTWMAAFVQLLVEDCRLNQIAERLASISMIIFNYDRCVEHYLFHSLQNYYGIDEVHTAQLLSNLQVFHPYGTVGGLPWNGRANPIVFGGEPTAAQLVDVSNQIKTFTEGTDPRSSEILRMLRISLKAATDFAARRPVISRMTARVRRDVDLGWSVA